MTDDNSTKKKSSNVSINLEAMNRVDDVTYYINHAKISSLWIKDLLVKSCVVIGSSIYGKVAELGAGTGCLTSILSNITTIESIYAVEYSENFINKIMPEVFKEFKADESKIDKKICDFNNLEITDNSLDFVFEVGAFHHSWDIARTIKETMRVLKPDGYFIGFDRSHPNRASDEELSHLLEKQISKNQKIRYGYNENDDVTRADMGEHEYRINEWRAFFQAAGFNVWFFQFFNKNTRRGKFLNIFIRPFENLFLKRKVSYFKLPAFKKKTLIVAKKPE